MVIRVIKVPEELFKWWFRMFELKSLCSAEGITSNPLLGKKYECYICVSILVYVFLLFAYKLFSNIINFCYYNKMYVTFYCYGKQSMKAVKLTYQPAVPACGRTPSDVRQAWCSRIPCPMTSQFWCYLEEDVTRVNRRILDNPYSDRVKFKNILLHIHKYIYTIMMVHIQSIKLPII